MLKDLIVTGPDCAGSDCTGPDCVGSDSTCTNLSFKACSYLTLLQQEGTTPLKLITAVIT
jgi:hypothetical protein